MVELPCSASFFSPLCYVKASAAGAAQEAVFEPRQAGLFEISDEGTMFSAIASTTAAFVMTPMVVTAVTSWEMQLVHDNRNGEASCFGIARSPLANRTYNSSPDMWLIRCFNGTCAAGVCVCVTCERVSVCMRM